MIVVPFQMRDRGNLARKLIPLCSSRALWEIFSQRLTSDVELLEKRMEEMSPSVDISGPFVYNPLLVPILSEMIFARTN